jgi:hypothetical protein
MSSTGAETACAACCVGSQGTTLMDVLTHLPAYLPVDERVEEYTVSTQLLHAQAVATSLPLRWPH